MAVSNPLPTFIPQNVTDATQLQLLHQIQSNQIPALNALILGILLKFPLPESLFSIQSRLNLYNTLTASTVPVTASHNVNPLAFASLIVFWPLWFILGVTFVYFLMKALLFLIRSIFPVIFSKFIQIEPKTFLELTFPSDTSKSAYATEQLYNLLHTLGKQQSFSDRVLKNKKICSLEIVSSKEQGIRYILVTPFKNADVIKRSLLSYLPGIKIKEVDDYLDESSLLNGYIRSVVELKLVSHLALPLQKQKVLSEHDPISYLTGNMTKLDSGELISFQVITTPVLSSIHTTIIKKTDDLRKRMYQGLPLTPALNESVFQKISALPGISVLVLFVKVIFSTFRFVVMFIYSMILGLLDPNSKTIPFLMTANVIKDASRQALLNPYEQELQGTVKGKIDQPLFEASIRLLVLMNDPRDEQTRVSGLLASFGQMSSAYQAFVAKNRIVPFFDNSLEQFTHRRLSVNTAFNQNPILSASELSDIYHFPYTDTTKTEGLVKVHSRELPAPLSLKQKAQCDLYFAKNTYGGTETKIGLTADERRRHVYILGATGTGKSTMLLSMIQQDIEHNKGLCVIDPHGDLIEQVLSVIPRERIADVVYFNPDDISFPMGINLLELTPGLSSEDAVREKEFIAESIISVFCKIFSEKYSGPRMEYILRNTIHTAFSVPDATLFTVNKLLINTSFRKSVVRNITDENLQDFWKYEFAKAGDYQKVNMISPITNKIGRFLFSPTAKRILEQGKSTINFDTIMNEGKILLCNLSKGKIGEDNSSVFGALIMAKIQLSAFKRARMAQNERKDFFLYVDEFQNFATPAFAQILSEARKYRLGAILAHQTTSQIEESSLVNITLANTGTVICFRTANPEDERMILPQFRPYIEQGEIASLPSYRFYMRLGALNPEEPFSGVTIPVHIEHSQNRVKEVIESSRHLYAKEWKETPTPLVKQPNKTEEKSALRPINTGVNLP